MDAKMNIQEVRVIENCCDNVFDNAVGPVCDAYESFAVNSGDKDSFAEDAAFVGNAR